VRWRRLCSAVLGIGLLLWLAGAVTADDRSQDPDTVYTVRGGDTVWEIASREVGSAGDPRPVVDAIVGSNAIDPGALAPGSELWISAGG